MIRRVQRCAVPVEQQGEVVDGQGEFAESRAVPAPDDCLGTAGKRQPRAGVQPLRSGLLHNECTKESVLLVGVGEEVVVEKDSVKRFVGEKALDQGFIPPGSGDVVPTVGTAVGDNGVEFHQMDVEAHDVGECPQLEGAAL